MFKKILAVLIIISVLFSFSVSVFASGGAPGDSAKASILMIQGTNEVLYSKNSDKKMSMASTTKIMTAILAIENGNLDEEITVTDEMVRVEGTSAGLLAGDKIDLLTLVYCMLLQSGNDAANVTAYAISGSSKKFVELMNSKAKEIGMKNTHFSTPSGLDADDHYSTAYDMALLASYALKNPVFKEACSTYKKTVSYGNPKYSRTLTNHNKMLKSYEGMIGVKTGFTKKSGRCLVTAAERSGVTLICVTLDDWSDWNDHKNLLDYGFSSLKNTILKLKNDITIPVVGSPDDKINVKMLFEPKFFSSNSDFNYTYSIEVEHFLYAPVKISEIVGKITFFDKNKNEIASVPLIASDNADLLVLNKENNEDETKKEKKFSLKRIFQILKGEK